MSRIFRKWHFRKRCSILWVTLEKSFHSSGQRNDGSDAVTVRMNEGKQSACRDRINWLEQRYITTNGNWESYFYKGSISLSHVEKKGSILWVIFSKKGSILGVIWEKGFNSLSHFRKRGSILWVTLEIKGSTFGQRNEGSDAVTVRMNEGKKSACRDRINWLTQRYITTNGNWSRRMKARQKLANPFGCRRHHSGQILTFWESKPLENSAWTESTLFIQFQEKCWTHDCASVDTTQVNISADVDVIHYDAEKKHRFRRKFNSLSHVQKKKKVQFCEPLFFSKKKSVQFFESWWTKGFNLWVVFLKTGSILWVIKRAQFCESRKQGSILWVTFEKKGSILWVAFQKGSILWVVFKRLSHIQKGSIMWIVFTKRSVMWVVLKKRVQFLKIIFSKKSSILWVKKKKVEFFESCHKEASNHTFFKRVQFLESYYFCLQKVQFCESHRKEKSVQFFESFKKGSILLVFFFFFFKKKKGSILWNIFFKKVTILWVMLKRDDNSVTHIWKKRKQFFETYLKRYSILWFIFNSLTRVVFLKKNLSHIQKKFYSLSRIQQKGSILRVILKKVWVMWKKGSILCVVFSKIMVQFCVSY